MVLILDDHAGGRRLREWNFLAKDAFEVPPARQEGIFFVQLIRGQGAGPGSQGAGTMGPQGCVPSCSWEILLTLYGSESAAVSIGAHYLDLATTPQMEALYANLPKWSRGAEFLKSISALEQVEVARGGCRPVALAGVVPLDGPQSKLTAARKRAQEKQYS